MHSVRTYCPWRIVLGLTNEIVVNLNDCIKQIPMQTPFE